MLRHLAGPMGAFSCLDIAAFFYRITGKDLKPEI